MTDREQMKETLIESARDITRKLADLDPGWRTKRAALVDNLREVARAYGELSLGARPETIEVVTAAGHVRDLEISPRTLDDTFEIGGHQIKVGHGPGWVVMNLFAAAGNPLAAWDGTPDQIRELAYALLQRAALAEETGASFDVDELLGPRDTGAESN